MGELELKEMLDQKSELNVNSKDNIDTEIKKNKSNKNWDIVWKNVVKFSILHLFFVYGMYLILTLKSKWQTIVFAYFYIIFGTIGVTAGTHRLWSHRSFKANFPLRFFLMIAQSASFQNPIYVWARDHRMHHKYTDTNADPHNIRRGLFFAHIRWLLIRKHEEVKTKGKTIDMSDVLADPVVKFQNKYYMLLVIFWCFALPAFIPWYFWHEDLWHSGVISVARYVFQLNSTFLVNSFAHAVGMKPFDRFIFPTENKFIAFMTCGEGWHNYHHTFPWDYKTSELGNYGLNITTGFIDLMAKIGWATDLKTTPKQIIYNRIQRTGDPNHLKKRE